MTTRRAADAAPRKNPKTNLWDFVVDLGPGPDTNGIWRERRQARRRGFATRRAALEAMDDLRSGVRKGEYVALSMETVGDWMVAWMDAVSLRVKPSTAAFYRRYGEKHLIVHPGRVPL